MFVDLPLPQLRQYRPERAEPADFDAFWQRTLGEARAHDLAPEFTPVPSELTVADVFDVTFAGFGGHPIKGWLLLPRHVTGPVPCVIEYQGYGGGRGLPIDWLLWPSFGYAVLAMDSRGQEPAGGGAATPPTPTPARGRRRPAS
ncbi:acetylxylan esterase [Nonomuraea thailandensis]